MDSEQTASLAPVTPWMDHGARLRTWTAPDRSVRWAFGLQWTATLGRRSRQWLFDQLRRQNLRWYASSGSQNELVGMDMSGQLAFDGIGVFSAAVGYARSHPEGTHLLRLTVTPARQWVVGVHQGSVLSHTDCWVDVQAGDELQASLAQRFTDLSVQTVTWIEPDTASPPAELTFLREVACELARCRRLRFGVSGGAIWLAIGGMVCALGAGFMWVSLGWWPLRPEAPERLSAVREPSLLPVIYVHRMADLEPLWQVLLPLPVDPDGWLLQNVDCRVGIDSALCRAEYARRRATTDNDALSALTPSVWRLKPVSLEQSHIEAQVRLSNKTLQPQPTSSVDQWLVTLQRQSAITPSLRLGPWREQAVGEADLSVTVRSREISLRLPVRQLSALESWSLPVFWQSIRLEVMPQATVDPHNSYLMLHLKGELRALKPNAS